MVVQLKIHQQFQIKGIVYNKESFFLQTIFFIYLLIKLIVTDFVKPIATFNAAKEV